MAIKVKKNSFPSNLSNLTILALAISSLALIADSVGAQFFSRVGPHITRIGRRSITSSPTTSQPNFNANANANANANVNGNNININANNNGVQVDTNAHNKQARINLVKQTIGETLNQLEAHSLSQAILVDALRLQVQKLITVMDTNFILPEQSEREVRRQPQQMAYVSTGQNGGKGVVKFSGKDGEVVVANDGDPSVLNNLLANADPTDNKAFSLFQ